MKFEKLKYLWVLMLFIVFSNVKSFAFLYTYDGNQLSYDILSETDKTCKVTGLKTKGNNNLNIPEQVEYNGSLYSVKEIGSRAFYNCSGFTGSLTIPSSVNSIGERAFYECSGFTGSLTIPSSVNSIGEYAFYKCSGFTGSLTIPDGVTSIEESAFYYCSGFTGSLIIPSSVTSIGIEAFQGCSGFTGSLIIPESVTYIGSFAFAFCRGFTGSLTIPESVTHIGSNAFNGCQGFTGSLTILSNITAISESTFYKCYGFTGSLTIPESVTSIGNFAFLECSGFTGSLTIPGKVTSIGHWSFKGCSGFTGSLIIPSSVTSIGTEAFAYCSGFTGSLIIPENITSIEYNTFGGCSGFTGSLTLPRRLTSIGNYAFNGCSGFTGSLIIPGSVATIGKSAFRDCSGVTGSLTIPKSVTSIGDSTLYNCNFEKILCLRLTPPNTGDNFYNNFSKTILEVPVEAINNYSTTEPWKNFNNIQIIPIEAESIEFLNGNQVSLALGGSKVLEIKVLPENYTTSIFWESSNDIIVTVDQQGRIKGVSSGKAEITVTSGNASASCSIEVIPLNATSVTLNSSKEEILEGSEIQLVATLEPEKIFDKTIIWESGDTDIATVSKTGIVKGISVGSTYVKATNGEVSATCEITVLPVPSTGIIIDIAESDLLLGSTIQLTATVQPENATDKTITWISDNNDIISVTDTGLVTGLSLGSGIVTATNSDFSASCEINVIPVPASGIILSIENENIRIGGTSTITATVEPSNTTYPEVTWSSSDENIATISPEGVIKGISEGVVTFTATCGSVQASCEIMVKDIQVGDEFTFEGINYVITSKDEMTCSTKTGSASSPGNNVTTETLSIPSVAIGFEREFQVAVIGAYSFNDNNISIINLPETIESIGAHAFDGCASLTEINIPANVTTMGVYAFNNCTALQNIELPNLTTINSYLFSGCTSLSELTIPGSVNTISPTAFYGCTGIESLILADSENPIEIASGTFTSLPVSNLYIGRNWSSAVNSGAFPESVESVTLGENVTTLAPYAFANLSKLQTITLPENLTTIPEYAFTGCISLTGITLPASVSSIGTSAFYGCSSLESINIPSAVSSIDSSIFALCTSLTSLTIEDSEDPIELAAGCFAASPIANLYLGRDWTYPATNVGMVPSVVNLTFGSGVTEIPMNSFSNCTLMEKVSIPASVLSIGNNAFNNCSALKTLEYSANCTSFGRNVFPGTIENLTIGENVTAIPDNFLMNGNQLQTLWIPNAVKTIGNYAFSKSYTLKSLWLGTGLQNIFKLAFYENASTNSEGDIYEIPKIFWLRNSPPEGIDNVKGMINYVSNNSYNFNNYKLYASLSSYLIDNGIVYIPLTMGEVSYYDIVDCSYGEENNRVNVPATLFGRDNVKVSNISDYAFYDNDRIESLTLANNRSIGNFAFYSCNYIPSVVIPASITELGTHSFQNCNLIESVVIGESIPVLPEYVFAGCSSLGAVSVPSNIDSIDDYAFAGCTSLSSLRFEESFTDEDNDGNFDEEILTLGSNGSHPLFNDCPLETVFIGRRISYNSDAEYGYSPFYRNETLTTAEITDRETRVYDNEFYGCSDLKTLSIGNGVTSIGNWAFSGCSSLEYFSAGYKVLSIGEEAFSDCVGLRQFYSYSQTPPECGEQALDDIRKGLIADACILYVPANSKDMYLGAPQWNQFFFNIQEMDPVEVENIILNVNEFTIAKGDTFQLEATVLPENTTYPDLIWTSSDLNFATVSSTGLVKAVEVGSGVITVKTTNSDIEVYCNFDVVTEIIEAEGIELNLQEVTMQKGETITLTVTFTPENVTLPSVTWSSSDLTVATVDNGVVTAIETGEAIITATTTNGKTATCTVTVKQDLVLVEYIELSETEIKASQGSEFVLSAVVYPDNATTKTVEWSSSNDNVVSVDSTGLCKVLSTGYAIITATATDGSGVSAQCVVNGTSDIEMILENGREWNVFNIQGALILKKARTEDIRRLNKGIYIFHNGSTSIKANIR